MTYDLFIADKTYSSWSLRGWLMFENFGIPAKTHEVGLYSGTFAQDMSPLAPARQVPVMRTPEGEVVGETLAMAETLHERHPEAGLWPADPAARMRARWLASEMHAGFTALRSACPMNLARAWQGFQPSQAVLNDLARLETIWADAFARFGGDGPWLFGRYSLADVFFAPVAGRVAGYGLPVGPQAAAYVAAHLADPAFRRWRAEGLAQPYVEHPDYMLDLPHGDWPGPA
ncbi:glutathione S-transferase [Actibacterium sp. XHP0104]|uniref:glutathione S-transferase n=1 Tax=Actibacterium sp. XHP0104 TaxID=2984335 RepID=UPI0021E8E403|nr:glutathione S-transferase [Actibacterium sp. XHP0104]MCV2882677.1 glutathione S-transferase [Actibacterium sp. XHP0104]